MRELATLVDACFAGQALAFARDDIETAQNRDRLSLILANMLGHLVLATPFAVICASLWLLWATWLQLT